MHHAPDALPCRAVSSTGMDVTATDPSAPLPVRSVQLARPLHWLRLGWQDFMRTPIAGLTHGAAVALAGWAAILLAPKAWWLAPGAVSGFVLVAPILCTGLYELSRLLGRGEQPGLADAARAWRRDAAPLVGLGLLLTALGTAWVMASALLFWLFVTASITTPLEFIRYAVVGQGHIAFSLWLLAGGLGCALVFAITAVSPPLLLGRRVGLRCALLTSVRAVGENPLAMAGWAALILAAIGLSLATAMLGFLITVPVIGHATWHAYRELVITDGVALRSE
jgi:uncharacterized membrane protein